MPMKIQAFQNFLHRCFAAGEKTDYLNFKDFVEFWGFFLLN